ncbi:MAG: hypothetical protein ACREBG_05880 [Pyrinomonadaceae bacterium]
MKNISLLLVLGFAFSLCNLTSKLKEAGKGDPTKSAPAAKVNSAAAERPEPTAAQIAALSGGQNVSWDKQGISWTVPAKWVQASDEEKMFVWRSPGSWDAASLIVNISTMDESFPTDISLNAFHEQARTRSKNGEVDELRWLEIDGLKGVQFRESNPAQADDTRRLQWLAYRKYAGQVQMVNLMLAARGKDFSRHEDAMYGILYSTKIVH